VSTSSSSSVVDLGGEIVVDHHTHPIADAPIEDRHFHPFGSDPARLTGLELLQCFSLGGFVPDFLRSDGHEPTAQELERLERSAESTLLVAYALKELARFFGCAETPDAIAEARRERAADYAGYVRSLFAEARIDTVFVDNGWPQPTIDVATMRAQLAPARVEVVFRIEPLLERLAEGEKPFSAVEASFEEGIRRAVEQDGYRGYKSIIAYRSGLAVRRRDRAEAERALEAHRRGEPEALGPLREFLFVRALETARELGVPLHVHCGIGDNDIRMRASMPQCLFELLTDPGLRHAKVVLVHGGYPWLQEGAFLANVLPNVFVDISLSCPATGGALRENLLRVLELAPFNKILYGSDGLTIPEIAWVSAHLIRKALGEMLTGLVERGYISHARALDAGRRILWQNAYELYGLDGG
jgi:predicted TIM-barrel fold metal-dependent hydrolase